MLPLCMYIVMDFYYQEYECRVAYAPDVIKSIFGCSIDGLCIIISLLWSVLY